MTLELLDLNLFVLGPEEQMQVVSKYDRDVNEISLDQNEGELFDARVISGVEPGYETQVSGDDYA